MSYWHTLNWTIYKYFLGKHPLGKLWHNKSPLLSLLCVECGASAQKGIIIYHFDFVILFCFFWLCVWVRERWECVKMGLYFNFLQCEYDCPLYAVYRHTSDLALQFNGCGWLIDLQTTQCFVYKFLHTQEVCPPTSVCKGKVFCRTNFEYFYHNNSPTHCKWSLDCNALRLDFYWGQHSGDGILRKVKVEVLVCSLIAVSVCCAGITWKIRHNKNTKI